MFKEHTNVLSYYIITLILLNGYQDTLAWCDLNNTSLLQFKKTMTNLNGFCRLLKKNTKQNRVRWCYCSEKLFKLVSKKQKKDIAYLIRICVWDMWLG